MGLLDILTGNNAAASPWAALYPSPLSSQSQTDDFLKYLREAGETGLAPGQSSPFGDPSKLSVAAPGGPPPAPTGFGAGAAPFSFAGPGSNVVAPSQIAAPAPAPMPQPRPAAADAPPTDVPSVNRPVAPPAAANPPASAPVNAPAAAPVVAPAASPAPFSLGGVGDRLSLATKGFLGNMAGGPIGALAGGLGALVTGEPTDAGSIAKQQGTATAQALLAKGASVSDVQAAVHNPALMKALIDTYYGKDKFKVVQSGENDQGKTFKVFNETDGTFKDIPGVPADASEAGGTIMGPNGKPIAIPPGVNRKEFVKRISEIAADAAGGKTTEAQNKASAYATRMEQAESQMGKLQNQGLNFWDRQANNLPGGLGNYVQSPQYQQYKQAQSAFITALLRQESGAAINKSEFDRYEKEMFPQPGDDPAVVQQKAQMRAAAVQQMRRAAGPGYQSATQGASGTVNVGGQPIQWSVK